MLPAGDVQLRPRHGDMTNVAIRIGREQAGGKSTSNDSYMIIPCTKTVRRGMKIWGAKKHKWKKATGYIASTDSRGCDNIKSSTRSLRLLITLNDPTCLTGWRL